jgi:hypothetical protein
MGFSNQERTNILFKTIAAGVVDANQIAQWYESRFPYESTVDAKKVWYEMEKLRLFPASNVTQAQNAVASGLSGTVQDYTLTGTPVKLTAVPGSGNSTFVALSTYGDFTSARLDNWVSPTYILQTDGTPSNGYAVRLWRGNPDLGGTEILTTEGQTGSGETASVAWFYNYSMGLLLLSADIRSSIDPNDLWITGFRYIGLTALDIGTVSCSGGPVYTPKTENITVTTNGQKLFSLSSNAAPNAPFAVFVNGVKLSPLDLSISNNIIFYNGSVVIETTDEVSCSYFVAGTNVYTPVSEILTVATNGQTSFSLTNNYATGTTFLLFINGVKSSSTDFNITGYTLNYTGTAPLQTTDEVSCVYYITNTRNPYTPVHQSLEITSNGQTSFILTTAASIDAPFLLFLNGARLNPSEYSVSSNVITYTGITIIETDDELSCVYYMMTSNDRYIPVIENLTVDTNGQFLFKLNSGVAPTTPLMFFINGVKSEVLEISSSGKFVSYLGSYSIQTTDNIFVWYYELNANDNFILSHNHLPITSNGQTAFTLPVTPSSGKPVILFLNGVKLNTSDYSVLGNSLTYSGSLSLLTTDELSFLCYVPNTGSPDILVNQNITVGNNGQTAFNVPSKISSNAPVVLFVNGVKIRPSEVSGNNNTITYSGSLSLVTTDNITSIYYTENNTNCSSGGGSGGGGTGSTTITLKYPLSIGPRSSTDDQYQRIGGGTIDTNEFPNTMNVKFSALLETTNPLAEAQVQIYRITDGYFIAGSVLQGSSTLPEIRSTTLFIPSDILAGENIYEIYLKRVGGSSSDIVTCLNAWVEVTTEVSGGSGGGGSGSPSDLATVLTTGNITGGNNIVISTGDSIVSQSGPVEVTPGLNVNGDLTVADNATISEDLTVNGISNLNTVNTTGDVNIGGSVNVDDNVNVDGYVSTTSVILPSVSSVPGGNPATGLGKFWLRDDGYAIVTNSFGQHLVLGLPDRTNDGYETRIYGSIVTNNDTPTTIVIYSMNTDNRTSQLLLRVIASEVTTNEAAIFVASGGFHRLLGNTTQIGSASIISWESDATAWQWYVDFSTSSNNISVNAVGELGKTIRWTVIGTAIEV